ncbi:ABC transporter permease [Microbacterium gorillae]|uniref:ABC transporter permease n=1 Tax=Microbacterium gorillae TaxID=1231063 RepID=UPI00058D3D0A|nr:iron chelate uptake ABC transporter family permease subunit [Microbacterium gorillae]
MTQTLLPSAPVRRRVSSGLLLALALIGVLGLMALSLSVGAYDLGSDDFGAEMFWITRVPRTLALVLAACAMCVSGMIMQLLTQNRFVEPTTTGTTEWAGLGLLAVTLLIPTATTSVKMVAASIAAFVGTMIFLTVLRRIRLRSSLVVPLIGMMLGAVVSAFSTFLAVSTSMLQMLGTWFMGSFSMVMRGRYETLWVIAIIVVLAWIVADRFTVAGLGKDIATSVGMNYERVVFFGTALVAVATGVTTVVVGALPFLGLVVPNLVSMIRGDNLRSNIPWVCVTGTALILVCDIVGRVIRFPFEVPVSMILGVIGAAVFITMLLRMRARG